MLKTLRFFLAVCSEIASYHRFFESPFFIARGYPDFGFTEGRVPPGGDLDEGAIPQIEKGEAGTSSVPAPRGHAIKRDAGQRPPGSGNGGSVTLPCNQTFRH